MNTAGVKEVRNGLEGLLPRLWRVAATLTGSAHAAEDLVQLTCEKMLRRSHQYTAGTKLDSWAFTIMVNEWRSELRRPQNAQGLFTELSEELSAEHGCSPEANAYLSDILRAIDGLPPMQRAAVALVYGEGRSYQEAADLMDVPIGTVMSRLHAARIKLRPLAEEKLGA